MQGPEHCSCVFIEHGMVGRQAGRDTVCGSGADGQR